MFTEIIHYSFQGDGLASLFPTPAGCNMVRDYARVFDDTYPFGRSVVLTKSGDSLSVTLNEVPPSDSLILLLGSAESTQPHYVTKNMEVLTIEQLLIQVNRVNRIRIDTTDEFNPAATSPNFKGPSAIKVFADGVWGREVKTENVTSSYRTIYIKPNLFGLTTGTYSPFIVSVTPEGTPTLATRYYLITPISYTAESPSFLTGDPAETFYIRSNTTSLDMNDYVNNPSDLNITFAKMGGSSAVSIASYGETTLTSMTEGAEHSFIIRMTYTTGVIEEYQEKEFIFLVDSSQAENTIAVEIDSRSLELSLPSYVIPVSLEVLNLGNATEVSDKFHITFPVDIPEAKGTLLRNGFASSITDTQFMISATTVNRTYEDLIIMGYPEVGALPGMITELTEYEAFVNNTATSFLKVRSFKGGYLVNELTDNTTPVSRTRTLLIKNPNPMDLLPYDLWYEKTPTIFELMPQRIPWKALGSIKKITIPLNTYMLIGQLNYPSNKYYAVTNGTWAETAPAYMLNRRMSNAVVNTYGEPIWASMINSVSAELRTILLYTYGSKDIKIEGVLDTFEITEQTITAPTLQFIGCPVVDKNTMVWRTPVVTMNGNVASWAIEPNENMESMDIEIFPAVYVEGVS